MQLLSSNANRAVERLRLIFCGTEPPLTRYYLKPKVTDWRNAAIFSFDLAMIVRGLAGAAGMVDENTRRETLYAIQSQLRRFISSDGDVLPFFPYSAVPPPDRWEYMRRGPFQLKTAAAFLFSGDALDEDLKEACIHTLEKNQASFPICPEENHASLYGVEGLILFGLHGYPDAWQSALVQYERCVTHHGCASSDVVAQFLRAGCILRREGLLGAPADQQMKELAIKLTNSIGYSGQIFYAPRANGTPRHKNTWSAMFAYQALTYYLRSTDCSHRAWLLLC